MVVLPLDDAKTRSILTPERAIAALRDAFADLRDGAFELPQRLALDGRTGNARAGYLVMPTRHTGQESLVVKTLSLVDGRDPMISGLVSWSSLRTTRSVVAPAETITAIRTGAITGLATDLLAAPEASRLAIFGAGALAADQVRSVHSVRPLTEVTFLARTPSRAEPVAAGLRRELPDTDVTVIQLDERDLSRTDIICCATTSTRALFEADELADTVHVNAVGSYQPTMHEIPAELIESASLVLVDDRAACLTESGELIDAVDRRLITENDLVELTAIIDGIESPGGRTVFKSVGVAVQDWAAMNLLAHLET